MNKNILILLGMIFFIHGCASQSSQFHYDKTGGVDKANYPKLIVSNDEPQIFLGTDQEKDALRLAENGYYMTGYSSSNAGNINENGTLIEARKLNASIVVLYSKYKDTFYGVKPLTFPNTQTPSAPILDSSNVTESPYSENMSAYLATYWGKLKPLVLGVQVEDLTPEIRKEIQSNKGVVVQVVMKGSPAYFADILKGDVLRKIGDTEIVEVANFLQAVSDYAGQKVIMVLYRNGEVFQKEIQLNEKS